MTNLASVRSLSINAFNVVPGVAFVEYDQEEDTTKAWVAMSVDRSSNTEQVSIFARRVDEVPEGPGPIETFLFNRDFNDEVEMIGVCIHPLDLDDNDWGS